LFSFAQAVGCAQAGVSMVSPFVGRIYDWYCKHEGKKYDADEDPGVRSVQRIYRYFKAYGYKTQIMAASFRTIDQILELVGVDKLTISPSFLEKFEGQSPKMVRKLMPPAQGAMPPEPRLPELTQAMFLFMHAFDEMAVDKLAEGIRNFYYDTRKLEDFIRPKLLHYTRVCGGQTGGLVVAPTDIRTGTMMPSDKTAAVRLATTSESRSM